MTPWTVAYQAPLSIEFYRQEYWSGLPCPPPGDLPDPEIQPGFPTLQSILYCWTSHCKSHSSLKSFLWCECPLPGVSICDFSSWVSSGCTVQEVDAAIDCLIVGILFLSQVPSGLSLKAAVIWWLDGYNMLCLRYGRQHFFSLILPRCSCRCTLILLITQRVKLTKEGIWWGQQKPP